MKLGFSVLSHQKPGRMMGALLKSLHTFPDKAIAIHHDFNQADFDESEYLSYSYELVKNYIRTYWSHTNNIHAIMETFKLLRQKDCDWYITLSANCYPIKSHTYITEFLQNSSCDGFIEHNNVLTDYYDFYQFFRKGFNTRYLFRVPYLNLKGKLKYKAVRVNRRPENVMFNNSYVPYHGSDWFMINKAAMDYLLTNEEKIQSNVLFLAEVNKAPDVTICPPEVLFQTVLANSGKFNLNNNNYRFIDWTDVKDWHPNILTVKDWSFIKESDALFARKFNWDKSADLIKMIDTELLNIE